MHAAVTRQRRNGQPVEGWYPQERITLEEAVWGYTMGNAVVTGQWKQQGSLSPGKLADLVVLDRDIFSIDIDQVLDTQVLMTVFDGRVVYEKE
jgi:predicted amidohydrolase YtcJ